MTDEHTAYEELTRDRRGSKQYRQGYAEARRAFLIGQTIRERRHLVRRLPGWRRGP